MGLTRRRPPRELAYAEVVTTVTPALTTYVDVAGGTITFTAGDRPILIHAWSSASPSNSVAASGGKMAMVRTDNNAVIGESQFVSPTANAPAPPVQLRKRLNLAPGTTLTVKLQAAQRVGAVCTYGASADQPIAIQAVEIDQ